MENIDKIYLCISALQLFGCEITCTVEQLIADEPCLVQSLITGLLSNNSQSKFTLPDILVSESREENTHRHKERPKKCTQINELPSAQLPILTIFKIYSLLTSTENDV